MVAVAAATALIIARHMTSDSATSARGVQTSSEAIAVTSTQPQASRQNSTTPVAQAS